MSQCSFSKWFNQDQKNVFIMVKIPDQNFYDNSDMDDFENGYQK